MKKKFVITKQEFMNAQWLGDSKQTILYILKSKGAPVKGNFLLEPDLENSWWSTEYRMPEGNLVYYIEEKPRGMI